MQTTSQPARQEKSTGGEPMKPAPPVTITRTGSAPSAGQDGLAPAGVVLEPSRPHALGLVGLRGRDSAARSSPGAGPQFRHLNIGSTR